MDDASGIGVERACGPVNSPMQEYGLAGAVATDMDAIMIQFRQCGRIQKTQAGIGGCDQETVIKPDTDIASASMHIAAIEQALANPADFFPRFTFMHVKTLVSWPRRKLF